MWVELLDRLMDELTHSRNMIGWLVDVDGATRQIDEETD